ncbi:MAG: peptidoglycan editing factor PgeF [Rhodocyclaceae bacterium]|nr:peptidoglycan editing factor PgeF [Rhodocyclaceae bacterium]
MALEFLHPEWPAPARVRALVTTRVGGVSRGPYASLNLAMHVGDDAQAVDVNRRMLRAFLPAEPVWLAQVHGTTVLDAAKAIGEGSADASYARKPHVVCAVLTADCLPVLICDEAASVVAAAHVGWRGLAAGILEATLSALALPPGALIAWLGPAIGPCCFEVGAEVKDALCADDPAASGAFTPSRAGKWRADLFQLARLRLARMGLVRVYGGGQCTACDRRRFYSYRREGATGRFASLIWLEK